MNLIEQFPDISMAMRAKIKTQQKNYNIATANAEIPFNMDKAMASFYNKEFRRWHFKLFFIVGSILATIYFALLKGSWVLNWITA